MRSREDAETGTIFRARERDGLKVEVLKSYDQGYAREAFRSMDEAAQQRLWESLKPEEIYDPAGLPKLGILKVRARRFFGMNCSSRPARMDPSFHFSS